MLDGGGGEDVAWLSVGLSAGQSDFESHDVVVHVVAVSDVEVALAEDVEAEVMVEADRRIVAVHVQFDSGPAPFNTPFSTPSCNLTHMSNFPYMDDLSCRNNLSSMNTFPHMDDLPCKSSLPHMSDRTVKQGSAESVALF